MAMKKNKTYIWTVLAAVIAVAMVFLPGCGKKQTVPEGPNIILITIDTLRADHLSCYGYKRKTSPFLDVLANQGVLFTQAHSATSWTAPAMASIFTGHHPRSHGVLHGMAKGPKAAISDQEKLTGKFLTIAEALKDAGYTTFGISSNGHISRGTGFAQGFDHFKTHWFMKCPAPHSTVKKWKDKIKQAERYFLWVHYFDPHNPYAPRVPWIKEYVKESNSYSKWTREVMANPKDYKQQLKEDPQALNSLIDRYDSEINYCDRYINELFVQLQPGPDTLVIITADHGEAFLDHDQLLHGDTLFQEEIRVPLIIKLPAGTATGAVANKTIDHPVSNRHVFATVMDVAGLKTETHVPGKSLMPLIAGSTPADPDYIFFELDWLGWARAVRSGKWKYILSGRENKERYLFNLETDPQEKQNLLQAEPEQVRLLESALARWIKEHPVFKAPIIRIPLDPDSENKLKTLGYL